MFDDLSERLQSTFASLGGRSELTLENIDEALKEVRRALLEADVSSARRKNIYHPRQGAG